MKDNLEEELFCTNYELKTLADLYFFGKAERWIKGFMQENTETEHLNRYKYALNFVKEKDVLEMACGSGFGCYYLLNEGNANSVTGVDLDFDAIRYGNHRYKDKNITRFVDDATVFSSEKKYDIITCFETIEHVQDYKLLIQNLHKNLKDNGVLLISTPITKITNQTPNNKYHVIEWNFSDFHKLFESLFNIDKIIVQNIHIEMKEWKVPNLLNKVKNRIIIDKTIYRIVGKSIEEFTNQYEMNKCISGFQLLVLTKKKENEFLKKR